VTLALTEHTLQETLEINDEDLVEISRIMERQRGFSMSVYKDTCMKRRITTRIRSNRCPDVATYCHLLCQNAHELDMLQKTLTIHVSHFFRNPSMFEKLICDVVPKLFQRSTETGKPLRIWSIGCAGGEEPYSLAILLHKNFVDQLRRTAVIINASDIDAGILKIARTAHFGEDRLKDVSGALRNRYFCTDGKMMRLAANIRAMVAFQQHDITAVRTYLPHDLVLCRNTLIYFTRPSQEKILHGIADILPVGGILVLGKSETLVGDVRKRFESVCAVERIYCKR
jgi:chemotaxis protein methyltransferase CheR